MKTIFKSLLLMFLFSLSYIISISILPFSQGFREISGKESADTILFMLIYALWNTGFVLFVSNRSILKRAVTARILFIYLFFIQFVLAQIETMFFAVRFSSITTSDIWLLMMSGVLPAAVIAIVGSILFGKKDRAVLDFQYPINADMIKKLTAIAFLYVVIYFVFGYFVAWQFEELRLFYADTTQKLSFIGQLLENVRTNPAIYPFQLLRGLWFGLAAFMLMTLFGNKNRRFIFANTIGFGALGIMLLIPNPLFPDTVRLAHFIEVTSSMLLFGFLSGKILVYKIN